MPENTVSITPIPPVQDPPDEKGEVAQVLAHSKDYAALLKEIRTLLQQKDTVGVLEAVGEVAPKVQQDVETLAPIVSRSVTAIKEGIHTSEWKMADTLNKFLTIVSLLAPLLDGIVTVLHQGTFGGGIAVTCVAVILKAIITVSYVSNRSKVKLSQTSPE